MKVTYDEKEYLEPSIRAWACPFLAKLTQTGETIYVAYFDMEPGKFDLSSRRYAGIILSNNGQRMMHKVINLHISDLKLVPAGFEVHLEFVQS